MLHFSITSKTAVIASHTGPYVFCTTGSNFVRPLRISKESTPDSHNIHHAVSYSTGCNFWFVEAPNTDDRYRHDSFRIGRHIHHTTMFLVIGRVRPIVAFVATGIHMKGIKPGPLKVFCHFLPMSNIPSYFIK